MPQIILIIGESGSGKSTSIRTLDHKETFVLNIIDKPLPFRGFKKSYSSLSPDGLVGNYYATDNYLKIDKLIDKVNLNRPEIKNLIIDDFQYTMCNEFMRRAKETGFTKFTEIGQHAWQLIHHLMKCREDLTCFVLSHSDTGSDGKVKCKTIGRMLEEKVTLEGMFTTVFHTAIIDGKYKFITQYDGTHIAKSPLGMFDDKYIDNDLQFVKDKITDYFKEI